MLSDGVERREAAVAAVLEALGPGAHPRERLETAIRAHLHALHAYGDYTSAGLKAYADAPEAVRRAASDPAAATRRSGTGSWRT